MGVGAGHVHPVRSNEPRLFWLHTSASDHTGACIVLWLKSQAPETVRGPSTTLVSLWGYSFESDSASRWVTWRATLWAPAAATCDFYLASVPTPPHLSVRIILQLNSGALNSNVVDCQVIVRSPHVLIPAFELCFT